MAEKDKNWNNSERVAARVDELMEKVATLELTIICLKHKVAELERPDFHQRDRVIVDKEASDEIERLRKGLAPINNSSQVKTEIRGDYRPGVKH